MRHFHVVRLVRFGSCPHPSSSISCILRFTRCQSTAAQTEGETPLSSLETPPHQATAGAQPHYISTLDPEKLAEDDYIDLSGRPLGLFAAHGVRKADGSDALYALPSPAPCFPADTRGFLYFSPSALHAPPTACALRFRLTRDRSPRAFALGIDLHHAGLRYGAPLVYGSLLNPVVQHLVRKDALLDDALVRRCLNLKREAIAHRHLNSQVPLVVARNQPFHFDFSNDRNHLVLLGMKGRRDVIMRMWIPAPSKDFEDRAAPRERSSSQQGAKEDSGESLRMTREHRRSTLYDGTALVRFERSPLPEHYRTKAMVLRIIKVLTPIVPRPDAIFKLPVVAEGSLMPAVYGNNQLAIWSWPEHERTTRLLWHMPAPGFYDAFWY